MEFSDWHRQQAAAIVRAHPLERTTAHGITSTTELFRASGNHRTADNDEREPHLFTDAELTQADLQSLNKAERFHQKNDRRALEAQVQASPEQWR